MVRLRIHRGEGSRAAGQWLLLEDVGQVAGAAGSVVLLAYEFWPGAIPAVAVLLWLGFSARRSAQRQRIRLTALDPS